MSIFYSLDAHDIWKVCDDLGSFMDPVITRGQLSEKYTTMFNDIALKLGIEGRDIKSRNSGIFLRVLCGYSNAIAHQLFNRVYFNEDALCEMDDSAVKFLMAHELAHHKKNDVFKRICTHIFFNALKNFIKIRLSASSVMFQDSYLHAYVTDGIFGISLWAFFDAWIIKQQEINADREAFYCLGSDIQGAKKMIEYLYNPDMTSWPLYAKIHRSIVSLMCRWYSLPVLNMHAPHFTSAEERMHHVYRAYSVS